MKHNIETDIAEEAEKVQTGPECTGNTQGGKTEQVERVQTVPEERPEKRAEEDMSNRETAERDSTSSSVGEMDVRYDSVAWTREGCVGTLIACNKKKPSCSMKNRETRRNHGNAWWLIRQHRNPHWDRLLDRPRSFTHIFMPVNYTGQTYDNTWTTPQRRGQTSVPEAEPPDKRAVSSQV